MSSPSLFVKKDIIFACKNHRNYFHEFTNVQALLDNRFFTTSLIAMKSYMDQLYEASLIDASLSSSYQRKTYIYHALLLHHPTYFKYFHLLSHNGRVTEEMDELVKRVLNEEFLTRYQNETQDNKQPVIKVLERMDLREYVQPLDYYTSWSNRTLTAQLALRDNPRVQEVVQPDVQVAQQVSEILPAPIFQINANPSVMVSQTDIPRQDQSAIIDNQAEQQRIISPKSKKSSGNKSSWHSEINPNRSEIKQSGIILPDQHSDNPNELRISETDRLNHPELLRLTGIDHQPGSGIFQNGNSDQLSPKYYKPVELIQTAPVNQVVTRSQDKPWKSPYENGNGGMHIPKNGCEMDIVQRKVDSRNLHPRNAHSNAPSTQKSTSKLYTSPLVTNTELDDLIASGPSTVAATSPSQKNVATPPSQRKRDSKYSQKTHLLSTLVPEVIVITDDKHGQVEDAYKYQADYIASQNVIPSCTQPRASVKKLGKRKREEDAVPIALPQFGQMQVQQIPPMINPPSSHQLDQMLLKMSRFEAQRAMQLTFMTKCKPLYDRRLVESLQGYASALNINTDGWNDLDFTSSFANKLDYDHYNYDRFPVHMRSPQRVVTPVFAFFDKGLTINHIKLRVLDSASLASPYDLLFPNLILDSAQGLSDIHKEVLTKFVQLYTPFHNFNVRFNSMSRSPTQNCHFTDVTSRQEIKDEDKVKYLTDKINALKPSQHLADIKHAHSIAAANIDKIRQVAQLSVLAMAPPGNDQRQD